MSDIFQTIRHSERVAAALSSVIDMRLFGQRNGRPFGCRGARGRIAPPRHCQRSDEGLPWCNQDINGKLGYAPWD
jgi:hypothetical protein